MKPNARIALAICFAVISTGTIVTCATTGNKMPPHAMKGPVHDKLKKFDPWFNEAISRAIRDPDTATFASYTCYASFVDHHIPSVPNDVPTPQPWPPDTVECSKLTRQQQQKLRAIVNDWIDEVYSSSARVSLRSGDPLPNASIDDTWFSVRVTNYIPTLAPADAGQ